MNKKSLNKSIEKNTHVAQSITAKNISISHLFVQKFSIFQTFALSTYQKNCDKNLSKYFVFKNQKITKKSQHYRKNY